ncbi:hypothetical protein [Rhodoflexus sp.]
MTPQQPICPILYPIGDQQFWGAHAHAKELAVKPIPINRMTVSVFLTNVEELLTNQQLYDKAMQMPILPSKENGLQRAISSIESAAG